jgi:hypothetical protein
MADPALRTLERALSSGDEAARWRLAAAYLRSNQLHEVLGLLGGRRDLPAEAVAVHDQAWRRELARLEPAPAVAGARDWGQLAGWLSDELVVIRRADQEAGGMVVDLLRGEVVEELAWRILAVVPGYLYVSPADDAELVLVTRPPHEPGARWAYVRTDLPLDELPLELSSVSPDRRLVLTIGRQTTFFGAPRHRLVVWREGAAVTEAEGCPWAVDWGRHRLVWWDAGKLWWVDLEPGAVPRQFDVLAAYRSGRPAHSLGLGPAGRHQPHRFEVLEDGRLLLDPPAVLVDLADPDHPTCTWFELPPTTQGPLRLSRRGQHLLGFVDGRPLRVPLQRTLRSPAPPPAAPANADGEAGLWHPECDLYAGQGAGIRGADGRLARRLPRDASPVGWTRDGRGLLVVRRLGPVGGRLEVWRAPGEQTP